MQIAITGDFHLGFNIDALPQAKNALKACSGADVILAAGDIFDSRIPRQETLNEALQLFAGAALEMKSPALMFELAADGTEKPVSNYPPILAIHGTHERRSKGLANPIHLLDSALAAVNLHGRAVCVENSSGKRTCFQAMGGVPEEFARQALKKMDFKPVPGAFNVFVFHQSLEEAMPFGEAIGAEDLPEGFDLYVDGHIHWMCEVKAGGKRIIIPGSTVVTQMRKNEMRPKSIVLFDTETGKYELKQFQTRPFVFCELAFEKPVAGADVSIAAEKALDEIASKEYSQVPVVKLQLCGKLSSGMLSKDLDLSVLQKKYSQSMKLHIGRDFISEEYENGANELRQARQDAKNVRELSVMLFLDALKKREITMAHSEAEELLDALCDEDIAKAAKLI